MTRSTIAGVVGIIVLTAMIVFAVWSGLSTYLESDKRVVAARNAAQGVAQVANSLLASETNERGYLLFGRKEYRDYFARSTAAVGMAMDSLTAASGGVGLEAEVAELRPQVDRHIAKLQNAMRLADEGKVTQAQAVGQDEASVAGREQLRLAILTINSRIDSELQLRLRLCRESMRGMVWRVMLGLGGLALTALGLVSSLWWHNRRERKLAEQVHKARDIAEAANKAKDEFLGIVSHELRTPLTPAMLTVGAMEKEAAEGSEDRECLMGVRLQLEHEARVVDDLLDMSSASRGVLELRLTTLSVHALLSSLTQGCAEEIASAQLRLEHRFSAEQDCVMGDLPRLQKVFRHILANAIKFTPPQGRIRLNTVNLDGRIVVEISDTGIGLEPREAQLVFEPFWQSDGSRKRRYGGMGIGLALSRAIVEAHGGRLDARSEGMGKGATFSIFLPLVADRQERPSRETRGSSPAHSPQAVRSDVT